MKLEVHDLPDEAREVAWALRRRGLGWAGGNSERELLFAEAALAPAELEAFYQQMHSYAFRLFLRDLIHHRDGFGVEELLRYVSHETAEHYLKLIDTWRLIAPLDGTGRWHLRARMARSFGETLEWYVAQLFTRGFGCTAAWGVRANAPGTGGDYDVLALVEGRLVCVEVKSSPPKHISLDTIGSFLRRIEQLGPALSIFVEDTHLRLEDKVVPMFSEALEQQARDLGRSAPQIFRERSHLYGIQPVSEGRDRQVVVPTIFVLSSRPSLEANLAYCLRRLLVPGLSPLPEESP